MALLCDRRTLVVVIASGWVLWHDVGVYRTAAQTRLAGPTYAKTVYESEAACQTGRQAAMAREAVPRIGPMTEQVEDGIMVWDPNRQYYTTFRYRCVPAGEDSAPFR